jgi:putative hemolysin
MHSSPSASPSAPDAIAPAVTLRPQHRPQHGPSSSAAPESPTLSQVREALDEARAAAAAGDFVEVRDGLGLLEELPNEGPALVFSGLGLGSEGAQRVYGLLHLLRDDVLLLAPLTLDEHGECREWVAVQPGGGPPALRTVRDPRLLAERWRVRGGLVFLCLAALRGRVSLRWPTGAGSIALAAGGPAWPLHWSAKGGRPGVPRLELGQPLPLERPDPQPSMDLDDHLAQRLRLAYLGLRFAELERQEVNQPAQPRSLAPLAVAEGGARLAEELEELDRDKILARQGPLEVWCLSQSEAPHLLREVGRVRERTFREIGEGTGRALDLDRFDATYHHLVLWNRERREVVGGYRLVGTDVVLPVSGIAGLYTHTLFDYPLSLFDGLGPCLELGRSFVRREYQKSYAPLLLLWKSIGAYLVAHPRYRTLFGAVSITAEYQPLSRGLMVHYLRAHRLHTELSGNVRSRRPVYEPDSQDFDQMCREATRDLQDPADLSALVASIEVDGKGLPTLLKEYLKLGARVLDFNVDEDFGNAVDGLIVIDLDTAEPRILRRYLGNEGLETFYAYRDVASASSAEPSAKRAATASNS